MPEFCLITWTESGMVKQPLVPPEPVTVGRLPGSTLMVDHPQVSRLHARLQWIAGDGLWQVSDAGSRAGTRLNGQRLEAGQSVGLAHGDLIMFGPVKFEFHAGAVDEGATLGVGGPSDSAERIEWLSEGRNEELSNEHLALLLAAGKDFHSGLDEAGIRQRLIQGVGDAIKFPNVAFVLRPQTEDDIQIAEHRGEIRDGSGRLRVSRTMLRKARDGQDGREGLVLVTDREDLTDNDMAASLERSASNQAFCIPVGPRGKFGFLYADSGAGRSSLDRASLEAAAQVALGLVRLATDSLKGVVAVRDMLDLVVDMVESTDPCTGGHSRRVAKIAELVAKEAGFDAASCKRIYECGRIHDIGKVSIDQQVLRKPGRLDDAEFAQIKRHPEEGHRILQKYDQFSETLSGVLQHHEKWDGTGYPHGLAGTEISEMGRVIAVADVFDALTCERPYRRAMPLEEARQMIARGSGTHFDPDMVSAFMAIPPDVLARYMEVGKAVTA